MLNPVRLNQTKLPAVARPKVPTTPLNKTSPNLPRMSQKDDCVAEVIQRKENKSSVLFLPNLRVEILVRRPDHNCLQIEIERAGNATARHPVTCIACIHSQHLQRARSTLSDSNTPVWRTCTCYIDCSRLV